MGTPIPPIKMADCGDCCTLAKANGGPRCDFCEWDHAQGHGHKEPKKKRGKR